MDIFAHSIWSAIVAKKADKKLNIGKFAFFGVFPDLLAFSIPFLVLFYDYVLGYFPFVWPLSITQTAWPANLISVFGFVKYLYPLGHSIVIFTAVFFLVRLIAGRYIWELLGWALHIFIDIFTHSATAFPTPFLWPLSDFKFLYGVRWSTPWFMILNYASLLIVFYLVFLRKKKI